MLLFTTTDLGRRQVTSCYMLLMAVMARKDLLMEMLGTTTDYTYDDNGNMTRTLIEQRYRLVQAQDNSNKITYNVLNLPETVTKSGKTMRYIYDASGRKLPQVVSNNNQTDYSGDFVYENNQLQFLTHEEGRVVFMSQNRF